MQKIIHTSVSRGHANHGWLDTKHTFSFANYYNPERIHFGALRVLNDDIIAAGTGFGEHPHDNMEIITIPLTGSVSHKDTMGNVSVVRAGEIQVMSAGSGIFHSEHNRGKEVLNMFQIWLFPNQKNVTPRYDQVSLESLKKENEFYQVLSPDKDDQGVWIYQDAWFFMGDFDAGRQVTYTVKKPGNGVYIMVVEGEITIDGAKLGKRDAIELTELSDVYIRIDKKTKLLVMDVPMS